MGGKVSETRAKEGRLRPSGFSRKARMAPSVAREGTSHCNLDSQLHGGDGQEYLLGRWKVDNGNSG